MKPIFNNCSDIKGLRFSTKEICPHYCRFLHKKKYPGWASIYRIDESFPLKPSLAWTKCRHDFSHLEMFFRRKFEFWPLWMASSEGNIWETPRVICSLQTHRLFSRYCLLILVNVPFLYVVQMLELMVKVSITF